MTQQRRLTNLRFADDVLLVAGSAEVLEGMLADLAREAGMVGLQRDLHGSERVPDARSRAAHRIHCVTGNIPITQCLGNR